MLEPSKQESMKLTRKINVACQNGASKKEWSELVKTKKLSLMERVRKSGVSLLKQRNLHKWSEQERVE